MPLDQAQITPQRSTASPEDGIDLDALAERVVQLLLQSLRVERERLGGQFGRSGSDY
jgi:hypothetical protein